MTDLEEAFNLVASKFGIQALNSHQKLAISDWLRKISDFSSFVQYLRGKGVTAASIRSCTEEEATLIEKGKFSVVFGSPEAVRNSSRGFYRVL